MKKMWADAYLRQMAPLYILNVHLLSLSRQAVIALLFSAINKIILQHLFLPQSV